MRSAGEKNVEAIAFAAEENPEGLTSVELLENGADAPAQDGGVLSQDDQILIHPRESAIHLRETPIYLHEPLTHPRESAIHPLETPIYLREPPIHLPKSPIYLHEPLTHLGESLIEHFPFFAKSLSQLRIPLLADGRKLSLHAYGELGNLRRERLDRLG